MYVSITPGFLSYYLSTCILSHCVFNKSMQNNFVLHSKSHKGWKFVQKMSSRIPSTSLDIVGRTFFGFS